MLQSGIDDRARPSWPLLLPDGLDAAARTAGLTIPDACRAAVERVLDTLEKHAVLLRGDGT